MSLEQYANLSNYALASAAVVAFLACLTYLAQWAFAREPAQRPPEAVKASTNRAVSDQTPAAEADRPYEGETKGSETALLQVSRYDLAGSIALSLTRLAWFLVLVGVIARGIAAERAPWGNMYEFAGVGTLLTLTAFLVLHYLWGLDWLGPIVTGFSVVALGLSMLVYVPAGPLVPALHSYWLIIHVFAALVSGAAFLLGAGASLLYLVKSRAERRAAAQTTNKTRHQLPTTTALDSPDQTGIVWRMPAAATIDTIAYRVHAFAFPVWTFAVLIAGPIWAQYAWGEYWGWDPKEVWALVTWVIYASYLHARVTAGWKGKAAAVLALIGFASFLFSFVGVNLWMSGLHSYAK